MYYFKHMSMEIFYCACAGHVQPRKLLSFSDKNVPRIEIAVKVMEQGLKNKNSFTDVLTCRIKIP